jgi:5-formyltetrahydrofolate cyclo-ligase
MTQAPDLRRSLRQARRALSPRIQVTHSLALAERLRCSPMFLHARRIGAYLAADGEIDPLPLLDVAFSMGKRCYLPVLHPFAGPSLWFCEWRDGDPLVTNRYAIPEPDPKTRPPHPAWWIDLLLVPLVGFDARGNRLGMGGGFYDRTLAYLKHRAHWRRPRVLGLAHELQRVDLLPTNAWDIPLDGVVTERCLALFHRERDRSDEERVDIASIF